MSPRYSILPAAALEDERVKDLHLRILAMLGTHTDNNGWCKVNQRKLGDACGRSRETVNRAIRDLCDFGYLNKVEQRSKSNARTISTYQVLMDRAPQSQNIDTPVTHTSQPPVTPRDHNPCDAQTSQLNDPYFNDQSSLRSDNPRERTPVDELMEVLDPKRAQAVVDHRKQIRKALTAYAAKLLAAQLGRWHSPAEAADAMIANGWQGFKPEWLENKSNGRASAPRMTALERARENFQQELADEQRQEGHQGDHHRSGDELPLLTEQYGR